MRFPVVVHRNALALVAMAATTTAAAPGRIVRVERSSNGLRGTPRICQLTTAGESKGTCFGKPPVVGEIATALSVKDEPGTLIVHDVVPSKAQKCANSNAWDFKYEVRSGDFSHLLSYETFAVFDVELDPMSARAVSPDNVSVPSDQLSTGHPGEHPYAVIDRNGDGVGDLALVVFPCDRDGARQDTSTPYGYCLEYWSAPSVDEWTRIREDIVPAC